MYSLFKRVVDIIFSIIGIIISAPILIFFILLIFVTGESSPVFITYRVGKNNMLFRMFKLRTMKKHKEKEMMNSPLTAYNDERISFLGKFLRFSKIDELPQFFNILNGDLSFVGPRPLLPEVFDYYDEKTKKILSKMTPGVTGIASLVFRDEHSLFSKTNLSHEEFYKKEIAPAKGKLEHWYFHNRGFWIDLKILIFTVVHVLFGQIVTIKKRFKGIPVSIQEIKEGL